MYNIYLLQYSPKRRPFFFVFFGTPHAYLRLPMYMCIRLSSPAIFFSRVILYLYICIYNSQHVNATSWNSRIRINMNARVHTFNNITYMYTSWTILIYIYIICVYHIVVKLPDGHRKILLCTRVPIPRRNYLPRTFLDILLLHVTRVLLKIKK